MIDFAGIAPLSEHGFRLLVTQKQMRLDRHGNLVPKTGVSRILRFYKGEWELDFMAIKGWVINLTPRFFSSHSPIAEP